MDNQANFTPKADQGGYDDFDGRSQKSARSHKSQQTHPSAHDAVHEHPKSRPQSHYGDSNEADGDRHLDRNDGAAAGAKAMHGISGQSERYREEYRNNGQKRMSSKSK